MWEWTENRLSDKTVSSTLEDMVIRQSGKQLYGRTSPCFALPTWNEDAMGAEAASG